MICNKTKDIYLFREEYPKSCLFPTVCDAACTPEPSRSLTWEKRVGIGAKSHILRPTRRRVGPLQFQIGHQPFCWVTFHRWTSVLLTHFHEARKIGWAWPHVTDPHQTQRTTGHDPARSCGKFNMQSSHWLCSFYASKRFLWENVTWIVYKLRGREGLIFLTSPVVDKSSRFSFSSVLYLRRLFYLKIIFNSIPLLPSVSIINFKKGPIEWENEIELEKIMEITVNLEVMKINCMSLAVIGHWDIIFDPI